MLRRLLTGLCLLSIAVAVCLTTSCGSSSSTTPPPCTGGPYSVAGDWSGTFSGNGNQSNAVGLISSAGQALFFDAQGDTAQLPTISGTCSFSGSATIYASQESQVQGAAAVTTGTAAGNVTSDTAINGADSFAGSSGSFTLAAATPISSPTALSGSITGQIVGAVATSPFLFFTLTPSGTGDGMSFTASDGNACTITGSFTQEGTSNVFDVSMTLTGSSCYVTGTITGLGFESSSDYFNFNGSGAGTYLYANMLGTSPFVVEIYP